MTGRVAPPLRLRVRQPPLPCVPPPPPPLLALKAVRGRVTPHLDNGAEVVSAVGVASLWCGEWGWALGGSVGMGAGGGSDHVGYEARQLVLAAPHLR